MVLGVMLVIVMVIVRMAAQLFHLARRHIAITPAFFLSFIPTGGALVITVTIMIIAVMVTIGMVFVLVLFIAAAVAISVASFGIGTGRKCHAEDQREQKLYGFGSHCGTLLPAQVANCMPL